MGQPNNERRIAANEARAFSKYIDSSPYKLNLVAEMIRGKNAGKALVDLDFSSRRVSREVKKVLLSAVANAENNHNLDVDKLVVAEASVGRAFVMKRWTARGRGKSAGIEKPFSNLTVIVQEREPVAPKRQPAAKAKGDKKSKTSKPTKTAKTAQAGA